MEFFITFLITAIDWPYKFSETPTRIRSVPPELGAHTEEVLTMLLGYSVKEVEAFRREGVI